MIAARGSRLISTICLLSALLAWPYQTAVLQDSKGIVSLNSSKYGILTTLESYPVRHLVLAMATIEKANEGRPSPSKFSVATPRKSPIKKNTMITQRQKQALLDNLQHESM